MTAMLLSKSGTESLIDLLTNLKHVVSSSFELLTLILGYCGWGFDLNHLDHFLITRYPSC